VNKLPFSVMLVCFYNSEIFVEYQIKIKPASKDGENAKTIEDDKTRD